MKISVSLSEDDVKFLDRYVGQGRTPSRSSAIHQAIGLLRDASLEDSYLAAWQEWESGDDAALWDTAAADGIADAAR
jgi:Arc/MetJ-type ribon-helix-helix transcriptional regulator